MSRYKEEPKNPGFDDGKCALCKKDVSEDDRCFGCGYLVCESCNINYDLMGPHLVVQHQEDPEDGDFL